MEFCSICCPGIFLCQPRGRAPVFCLLRRSVSRSRSPLVSCVTCGHFISFRQGVGGVLKRRAAPTGTATASPSCSICGSA